MAQQKVSSADLANIYSKVGVYGGIGGLLVGALVMLIFFPALGSSSTSPTSSSPSAFPSGTSPTSIGYTIPIRDFSVPITDPQSVKDAVKANWPNARLDLWDTVVSQSIINGWNPAFILSLWIEESGAQGASYQDALGCDPKHPTTDINTSLNCLFNNFKGYGNDRFADFMCIYGGDGFHNAPCLFQVENPNFPSNLKSWYDKLVPPGAAGSSTILPSPTETIPTQGPPPNGDLRAWIKDNFSIDTGDLSDKEVNFAYQVLNSSLTRAPKLQQLIKSKGNIVIRHTDSGSHTDNANGIIYISKAYQGYQPPDDNNFFKAIFTHELGHRIKGLAGSRSPSCNSQDISTSVDSDQTFLTYYAENATPANVTDSSCGATDPYTQRDEDFAESISYYINKDIPELNYGSGCNQFNSSLNPYDRSGSDRSVPVHKAYMQCLLGP